MQNMTRIEEEYTMNNKCEIKKNIMKPFWSWNDGLKGDLLRRQMYEMKNAGIDGFFMHARGGLTTEYMGEDWFSCIEECLDYADELGMQAWAYDENGWPSGFANGMVPQMGRDFQQKMLKFKTLSADEKVPENLLGLYKIENGNITTIKTPQDGCMAIYYCVNQYYVDVFNRDCIAYFIECTHQRYYEKFKERFGTSLKGFFTDEPQFGNSGDAPWSQVFPEYFKNKYGYELLPSLPLLFVENEGAYAFRFDFYNMVSTLFRESFIKQIYDWCTAHNCKLTGHMMNEQSLAMQMQSTCGVMPCYEYFHEPGVDWLMREIGGPLVPKQLGSVARQLGKPTITESFGLSGWDVSLNELKWMSQWQLVNGVTSFCYHLVAYSLQGYRKRDYPPSFINLPWFERANIKLSNYLCKMGGILDAGEDVAPLLVIHPLQSVYLLKNPASVSPMYEYDGKFEGITRELSRAHILHHYGDEVIISHHGKAVGNTVKIGLCNYKAVLLPELLTLTDNTAELLIKFAENGGKIYSLGEPPALINGRKNKKAERLALLTERAENAQDLKNRLSFRELADITTNGEENGNIEYCCRIMPDGERMYYIINDSDSNQEITFSLPGNVPLSEWDIENDEYSYTNTAFDGENTSAALIFAPYGSHILKLRKTEEPKKTQKTEKLIFNNRFEITSCSPNALTLDMCEYRIDGGEWQPEKALIILQDEFLNLRRPCKFELKFHFEIENAAACGNMRLCMENPGAYSIKFNGKPFEFKDVGFFTDNFIRAADISPFVKDGTNEITLSGDFYQSENVYRVLFTKGINETERNKLTYDTELESMYITGNFKVETEENYHTGERRSIFGGRHFVIKEPVNEVDISKITESGFWFFSGNMELTQKLYISKSKNTRYVISANKLNAPAAEIFINGQSAGILAFAPYTIDVTPFLTDGENTVSFLMLSGNRNLLGPHHKPYGESHSVGPLTFTDKRGWYDPYDKELWTDNYNFVLFGIEF